jgi:large subunit ribosomal protein L22
MTLENTKVAKAYLRQVRISPRKVQIVLDLIRGKDAALAAAILKNTNKIACECVGKLLKSAVANAGQNHNMDVDKLYVAECFVSPGMLKGMKRIMPRAQGRAYRIIKRTSHITIVLKEKAEKEAIKNGTEG